MKKVKEVSLPSSTYQIFRFTKGFSASMFFKTIDRYIFKELLKIFIISTGTLTTVLYLDKFLFFGSGIFNHSGKRFNFCTILAILINKRDNQKKSGFVV